VGGVDNSPLPSDDSSVVIVGVDAKFRAAAVGVGDWNAAEVMASRTVVERSQVEHKQQQRKHGCDSDQAGSDADLAVPVAGLVVTIVTTVQQNHQRHHHHE